MAHSSQSGRDSEADELEASLAESTRGTDHCAMLCQVWRRAVARLKLEPERKADTRAMRMLTLAMF